MSPLTLQLNGKFYVLGPFLPTNSTNPKHRLAGAGLSLHLVYPVGSHGLEYHKSQMAQRFGLQA